MKKHYLIIALLYLLLPLMGSGQILHDGIYNSSLELLYAGMDNHPANLLLEQKPVEEKAAFIRSENAASAKSAVTSNANDLFRSNVVSGNWNNITSWESSSDGGISWGAATLVPTSAALTQTR